MNAADRHYEFAASPMALNDVLEDLLAEPMQPTVLERTRAMHQAVVRELARYPAGPALKQCQWSENANLMLWIPSPPKTTTPS